MTFFCCISLFFYFLRELPLYLKLEKSASVIENKKDAEKMMDYLKNKNLKLNVGTDGSVYYPFSEFVQVDPYHPFSKIIELEKKTTFTWYWDFPEKIWNSDYVVFYKRNPERLIADQTRIYEGKRDLLYNLFKEKTDHEFVKDTQFGQLILYKKSNVH